MCVGSVYAGAATLQDYALDICIVVVGVFESGGVVSGWWHELCWCRDWWSVSVGLVVGWVFRRIVRVKCAGNTMTTTHKRGSFDAIP